MANAESAPGVQLDDKAWALLQALQADGRSPLKVLAQAAGLSLPATAERLKRGRLEGKAVDIWCQEVLRELNTTGSKPF